MRSFSIRTWVIGFLCTLAACGGGGGGDSGAGADGEVLGNLEGDDGSVPGGTIVVGESSTTLFSSERGGFRLRVGRRLPIRVLAPGYLSRSLSAGPGDSLQIRLEEDPDPELAPSVTLDSLTPTAGGLFVRATVSGSRRIVDARAEVLGTDDGVVLTQGSGSSYSGTIRTSASGATVMVFAVDAAGRHAEDLETASGAPPSGSWTGSAEHWVGSFFGHHRGGFNFGRYCFNASFSVQPDGATSGLAAQVRLGRLQIGLPALITDSYTGTARVVGNNYKIEVEDATDTFSLSLMGSVSEDGGSYTGFAHGEIAGSPYESHFVLVNTNVRPTPWSASALATTWGLSFHYRSQATLSPSRYQYNVQMAVDAAGAVAPGKPTTLGPLTAAGASVAFADISGENLGYFMGSPGLSLDSGAGYDLFAFMGVGTKRVAGVWSSGGPSYGTFWGRRDASWSLSDLDAQWQGDFVVTSGPDVGRTLNARVTINSNGEVTGAGSIVGATGGTIAIQSGTLSFVDATIGAMTGSLSGDQQGSPATVNLSTPSLPESASMGVFHGRLIGKFSIDTNGDAGYYFLYRNSRN